MCPSGARGRKTHLGAGEICLEFSIEIDGPRCGQERDAGKKGAQAGPAEDTGT
jgi:hypothetical protein